MPLRAADQMVEHYAGNALLARLRCDKKVCYRHTISHDTVEHISDTFTVADRHDDVTASSVFIKYADGHITKRSLCGRQSRFTAS